MRALGAIVRTRKRILLLTTLVVVLAGLLVVWISRPTLEEFVGRDLRKLDQEPQPKWKEWLSQVVPGKYISSKSRLHRLLDNVLPEQYTTENKGQWYQPWGVWGDDGDSDQRFILLLVHPLWRVPGDSRAAVHFLSSTGKHLGCSEFSTGWRCDVVDAAFCHEAKLNERILEIRTCSMFSQSATIRSVYGIRDSRVALIRVEDTDGKFRADFGYGPEQPERTIEKWEALLYSSEPLQVLEALNWIGCFQRGTTTFFVARLREKASVQEKLAALCESENQWIREAAVAALAECMK